MFENVVFAVSRKTKSEIWATDWLRALLSAQNSNRVLGNLFSVNQLVKTQKSGSKTALSQSQIIQNILLMFMWRGTLQDRSRPALNITLLCTSRPGQPKCEFYTTIGEPGHFYTQSIHFILILANFTKSFTPLCFL